MSLKKTGARWRPLLPADLPQTGRIADLVHPAYPEDPAVQADRLSLFPDGCWLAEGADGSVLGYAVAHPAVRQKPPALNTVLGTLPEAADCLYLHDVALLPQARGLGLGRAIVPLLLTVAARHRFDVLALTSVNGTPDFWRAAGFRPVVPDALLAAKLATYDAEAVYMEQPVLVTRPAGPQDAASLCAIYNHGIEGRQATFETRLRTEAEILDWFTPEAKPIVVVTDAAGRVLGFASCSGYRPRACYAGIFEYSVYVAPEAQGLGVGRRALEALFPLAKAAGAWKLVSRIFPENKASLALCRRTGFREVGTYHRHAQLDGIWRDVVIVEKLLDER
jgi:phosphinothricin acetyltransferase